QFVDDPRPPAARDAGAQLDAQHRALRAAFADADQRAAAHVRVRVEHRLDLFGAQGARRGDHALRLAAAEPEAAVGVEVAQVAHAVDDELARFARALTQPSPVNGRGLLLLPPLLPAGEGRGEDAFLADLREPGLRIAVEVRVGGRGAGDGDLADLARFDQQLVRPLFDGVVSDANDAHLVRRHRPAD